MPVSFECQADGCRKLSKVRTIHYYDGVHYVECEHCAARCKVTALPNIEGGPLMFHVSGLLEDVD